MTSTMPTTGMQAPVAPPRRKLGARLSGGHLLMIVSGIAAFVLVFALVGRGQAQVTVAVAVNPIDVDAQLTPAMVKPVAIPADSTLAASLVTYDSIGKETRYATSRIEPGTPIAKAQLSQARVTGAKVQSREMAIKVDRSAVAGGKIEKGDKIDVISVSNDGVACRVVSGLRVMNVESSSGGALSSSTGDAALTVAIEKDGDDLLLATTTGKKVQIVQATGAPAAADGRCSNDPIARSAGK